jgi:hypothetical protein
MPSNPGVEWSQRRPKRPTGLADKNFEPIFGPLNFHRSLEPEICFRLFFGIFWFALGAWNDSNSRLVPSKELSG